MGIHMRMDIWGTSVVYQVTHVSKRVFIFLANAPGKVYKSSQGLFMAEGRISVVSEDHFYIPTNDDVRVFRTESYDKAMEYRDKVMASIKELVDVSDKYAAGGVNEQGMEITV